MPEQFSLNKRFTSSAAGIATAIEAEAAADADVRNALLGNTPFPERDIRIATLRARAEAGRTIKLAGRRGDVGFNVSGGAFAGIGVFRSSDALLGDLGVEGSKINLSDIVPSASSCLVALRWGYDARGEARGRVALGHGSITASARASREAMYAVVREMPAVTGARDAISATVSSWALPSRVESLEDIEPGVWLIAEVEGAFAAKLGAQLGYEVNSVYETALGQLRGEIGFRLKLGLAATLGFEASGEFILVLSRPLAANGMDDTRIRLRLFKQNRKGWSFQFNAGASFTAEDNLIGDKDADEFVSAVFGLHGMQVIEELRRIEKWTDPNTDLADEITDLSAGYLRDALGRISGFEDAVANFEAIRTRIKSFVTRWEDLPHEIQSTLWKIASDHAGDELTSLREFLSLLSQSNKELAASALEKLTSRADFFRTPLGNWLEAAAEGQILRVISDWDELERLHEVAARSLKILDGSEFEGLLRRYQGWVNERLHLDKIREAIDLADVKRLDQMLRARLSRFLGKQLEIKKLAEIREAIDSILGKRHEFFGKAREALHRKYEFKFIGAWQETTTRTALLDLDFSFADGASHADVSRLLQEAVDGNFDEVLTTVAHGVTINKGVLTHQINRRSHAEVNLPFYKSETDHINDSLGKVTVEEDGGRIFVYDLKARDSSIAKNKRTSTLTVGANLHVLAAHARQSEINLRNPAKLTYSYQFRQASRRARTDQLTAQLKPYTDLYFPERFAKGEVSVGADTVEEWIEGLAAEVDAIESNGAHTFGNTLIRLDAALPNSVMLAWLTAPNQEKADAYRRMSLAIQVTLRRLIPFFYFADPGRYGTLQSAYALLVYSALPPKNEFRVELEGAPMDDVANGRPYWKWMDADYRKAMVRASETGTNLGLKLTEVHRMLASNPDLGISPGYYDPKSPAPRQTVMNSSEPAFRFFENLIATEAYVIEAACDAARNLARFSATASDRPSKAIEELAEFGSHLTDAFNNRISSVYSDGGRLRPLGTFVMLEASRALAGAAQSISVPASLDLIVLKDASQFDLAKFLEGKLPPKSDIAIEQRLVSLANASAETAAGAGGG